VDRRPLQAVQAALVLQAAALGLAQESTLYSSPRSNQLAIGLERR